MYVRLASKLRARLEELQARPEQPRDALRAMVQAHLAAAHKAAEGGAPVDVRIAERIADACMKLLDDTGLREHERSLVQGACLYFADPDDDEDDFTSMVGLEDDVQVVQYVIAQLGREDIVLD